MDKKIHAKKAFLLDGLGALLSLFLLGVVLVKFNSFFGIPVPTLYLLATFPFFFMLFDVFSYFGDEEKLSKRLKTIAKGNIYYCIISISLALNHLDSITYMGWLYLIIEVVIVVSIANYERKVAKDLNT